MVADLLYYTRTVVVLYTKYVTYTNRMARRSTHSLTADTNHSAITTITIATTTSSSRIT